ncbi:PTS mannose/fructose/sorbose/N-acetylgalactosamine transporter subunit IIC [Sporolactobacillus laevolacticus]|uniref:PTS mannose/fructose/sorbose/N-acetylgalactosamine transporter subunit IIC n=1 Tax=Sporolactobacillus laevolacticus TaxID=33018 RepID=UPI0025B49DFC|nr:PTS sugar transporter subunit IIC [Sporolactobacillus laevolacticus]MDN3955607.1 PTS sugar transporter subunit IIC [Sporolactobacillus laevolacticus]
MTSLIIGIIIILLATYMTVDQNGLVVLSYFPVIVGMFTGLITGDLQTGMVVGGTFQLMQLGVAALGGASVPNYGLATIVGAYIAIKTGAGLKAGIAVGLPVGMLAIQLDVVAKIVANFVAHKAQTLANEGKFKRMNATLWLGPVLFGLTTGIPTAIVVIFGPSVVNWILHVVPAWVTNGLAIAGGMLPVVGIAMLLHYMPAKKYLTFLLIGFVLAAYLNLPILAIAIVGFGAAYFIFNSEMKKQDQLATTTATNAPKGDDYDE